MSKPKAPTLPPTPTYQADPLIGQANQSMFDLGQGLTSGSIYTQGQPITEAINLNPQITQLMLQGLQAQLEGPLAKQRQDTINQLEANNQLTGSTTASALGDIDKNYTNQLVAAGANAGMADINRAMQNRVSLFGTGLNAIQGAGQGAQASSNAENQFNLENYQNQVAKVLGEQKQKSGGLMGALTGGLGGALAGSMVPGVGTLAGGLLGAGAGAFSPQGTGGALFQTGAGLAGSRLGGTPSVQPYNPAQSAYSLSGAIAPESIYGGLLAKSYYPY